METKNCGTCGVEKDIELFSRKNNKRMSKCKECFNLYYREYWKNTDAYEKHKQRVNANRPHRSAKYGITEDEYQDLFNKFNGTCHLCRQRKATDIDHCHSTGKVRGILCNSCNTSLGKLGDSVEGLQKAIDYLAGRRE